MRPGAESEIGGELEALCRACGLCCDGSLFGAVPLEAAELGAARAHRLPILPRGNAFEQPCTALEARGAHRVCAIYEERPRACRAFVCRLYDRHRREGGPLDLRLAAVRRVRALLAAVEHGTNDARNSAITELGQRIEDDFARA